MNRKIRSTVSALVVFALLATTLTPVFPVPFAQATTSGGGSGGDARDFQLSLIATGPGSEPRTLVLGVAPDATDGFDSDYDEASPPPPPGGFEFDPYIWSPSNSQFLRKLTKSFLAPATTVTWTLRIETTSPGDVSLEWSAEETAVLGDFLLHIERGSVQTDMRSATSLTYAAPEPTNDFHRETLTITLVLPPAPDLALSLDDLTLPTLVKDEAASLGVRIRNIGNDDATSATVTFTAGGHVETKTLGTIPQGGFTDATFTWTPTTAGDIPITFEITNSEPAEHSDATANNAVQKDVFVQVYGVSLSTLDEEKTTGPGGTLTYTAQLRNDGNVVDSYTLTATDPAEWDVTVSPATVADLAPGATADIFVTAKAPHKEVSAPESVQIALVAASDARPAKTDSLDLTAILDNLPVVQGILLPRDGFLREGDVDVTITFTKDMDPSAAVSATYGPLGGSHADHVVTGGFTGARTWAGTFTIGSAAMNGVNAFAISGGRDASGLDLVPSNGDFLFTIDTIAPVTTDDAPAAWQNKDVTVVLSVSDATATTTYFTTDGSMPTLASPSGTTVPLSEEGEHLVKYFSVDAAGNEESVKAASNLVRIDRTAPSIAAHIMQDSSDGWFNDDVLVELAATDDRSGVAEIGYRLGDSGEFTIVGGESTAVTVSAEGSTTLQYFARDEAGNEESGEVTIRIDRTPPETTLRAPAADGELGWHTKPFDTTISANDEKEGVSAISGIVAVLFRYDAHDEWTRVEGTSTTLTIDEEGETYLEYSAEDAAGNVAPPANRVFRLDSVAPVTNVQLSGIEGETGWWLSDVTVSLDAHDDTSGVAVTYYRIGEGDAVEYSGDPIVVEGDGEHLLTYWSLDEAGNIETERDLVILLIDTTDPEALVRLTGTRSTTGWYLTEVGVAIEADDATSGVASVEYTLNEGSPTPYSVPFTLDADGMHTLDVRVADVAGNTFDHETRTIPIDRTPPVVTLAEANPGSVLQGETVVLAATVVEENLASVIARVTTPQGTRNFAMTLDPETGMHTATVGPFSRAGTLAYVVIARDAAGHRGSTPEAALLVRDAQPPSISHIAPFSRAAGVIDVLVELEDNVEVVGATLSISDQTIPFVHIENARWAATLDTRTLPNGEHAITVHAEDNEGNTATSSRLMQIANAPRISAVTTTPAVSALLATPMIGDAISVAAIATVFTDSFSATLHYSVDHGATWQTTPSIGDGSNLLFDLGAFADPTRIHARIEVVDSTGLAARHPATGSRVITVFSGPDVADWIDATEAGSSETLAAEHRYADLVVGRVHAVEDEEGAKLQFGMKMAGPLAPERAVLYIVDFDVDADGAADYNVTATYAPGSDPLEWSVTWHESGGGPLADQASATVTSDTAAGQVVITVDLDAFLAAIGLPVDFSFRTKGSEDSTSFATLAVDVTPPSILLDAPATHTTGQDALIKATITDASGIAATTLVWALNNGASTTAGAATVDGDLRTWTIPTASLAAGTLAFFVKATDANGNAATVPGAIAVAASPPSATIAAPAQADQGVNVAFALADVSANAVSFEWDFGDGTKKAGKTPSHAFAAPGDHVVSVKLFDEFGNANAAAITHDIHVLDVIDPIVTITQPAAGAYLPAQATEVRIAAIDTGGIAGVRLSTDDGVSYAAASKDGDTWKLAWTQPADLVDSVGAFVLVAEATDDAGNVAQSLPVLATVDGIPPVAKAQASALTATAGVSLTFDATGSTDNLGIARYEWKFGSDAPVLGGVVTRSFAAGSIPVTLTVVDLAGNVATDTLTLTINAPTVTPPPPGGSSDSGTGSGSGTLPEGAEVLSLGNVAAGDSAKAEPSVGGITEIRLKTKQALSDVAVTVTPTSSAPAGTDEAPGHVHQYLDISVTSAGQPVPAASLESAEIVFRVPKAFLENAILFPVHVRLAHHNGTEWNLLDVTPVGEEDDVYLFVATTTEFSPFAVVARDVTPPRILDINPGDGAWLLERLVRGTYSDDSRIDAKSVTLTLNGALLTGLSATLDGFEALLDSLADGLNTLTLSVKDVHGNAAEKSWQLGYSSTAPRVAIESPASGSVQTEGSVPIRVGVTLPGDAPIDLVTALLDGTPVLLSMVDDVYTATATLGAGEHLLVVVVKDAAGAEGRAESTFIVDLAAPTIAPEFPAGKQQGPVTIRTNARDDAGVAKVSALVGDDVVATATGAPWDLVIDTTKLADGTHDVTILVEDMAGNTATATGILDVDNRDYKPADETPAKKSPIPGFPALAGLVAALGVALALRRRRA